MITQLSIGICLRSIGLSQGVDRRMLMNAHAASFPNVRLLAVSKQYIRSAMVTPPGN